MTDDQRTTIDPSTNPYINVCFSCDYDTVCGYFGDCENCPLRCLKKR